MNATAANVNPVNTIYNSFPRLTARKACVCYSLFDFTLIGRYVDLTNA